MIEKNGTDDRARAIGKEEGFEQTEGEFLVGVDFNPGRNHRVHSIKRQAAYLIDYVRDHGKDPRTAAIAITQIEQAAMWAVKAVTKPKRK